MSITGLIVEYNPFHNGHAYHLSKSKEITQSEYTVSVMSGHFLQRGEPAIFNKWYRTKMALNAGVDLVIELPTVYSCQSAEFFSYGAIQILEKIGIVNHVVFGSEGDNIEDLKTISQILAYEPESFQVSLKNELKKGLSFPAARKLALEKYLSMELDSSMQQPNNILGIEYLKWLYRFKSKIIPKTIERIGSDYHEKEINHKYASATAIRNQLLSKNNSLENLNHFMPASSLSIIQEALNNNFSPAQLEDMSKSILSIFMRDNTMNLKNILDISEGLDNRLNKLFTTNSIQEYIHEVKTKRYTYTRIQRILCHILLNLTEQDLNLFKENDGVQYIRVLGFNQKGKEILSSMKKNCTLPIITNLSKSYNSLNPVQKKMMDYDILATNLYNVHFAKSVKYKKNMDFYYSPIII